VHYLSDAERIWSRLKSIASGMSGRSLPIDDLQARIIVDRIISEERATSTPLEAREYFASQLRSMIDETRTQRL
jgi:hypothetical protein